MEKIEPVRAEIISLVTQYCGAQGGKFFAHSYLGEILPVFLHHSFVVVKELAGPQKAREQMDGILHKYSVNVPYV